MDINSAIANPPVGQTDNSAAAMPAPVMLFANVSKHKKLSQRPTQSCETGLGKFSKIKGVPVRLLQPQSRSSHPSTVAPKSVSRTTSSYETPNKTLDSQSESKMKSVPFRFSSVSESQIGSKVKSVSLLPSQSGSIVKCLDKMPGQNDSKVKRRSILCEMPANVSSAIPVQALLLPAVSVTGISPSAQTSKLNKDEQLELLPSTTNTVNKDLDLNTSGVSNSLTNTFKSSADNSRQTTDMCSFILQDTPKVLAANQFMCVLSPGSPPSSPMCTSMLTNSPSVLQQQSYKVARIILPPDFSVSASATEVIPTTSTLSTTAISENCETGGILQGSGYVATQPLEYRYKQSNVNKPRQETVDIQNQKENCDEDGHFESSNQNCLTKTCKETKCERLLKQCKCCYVVLERLNPTAPAVNISVCPVKCRTSFLSEHIETHGDKWAPTAMLRCYEADHRKIDSNTGHNLKTEDGQVITSAQSCLSTGMANTPESDACTLQKNKKRLDEIETPFNMVNVPLDITNEIMYDSTLSSPAGTTLAKITKKVRRRKLAIETRNKRMNSQMADTHGMPSVDDHSIVSASSNSVINTSQGIMANASRKAASDITTTTSVCSQVKSTTGTSASLSELVEPAIEKDSQTLPDKSSKRKYTFIETVFVPKNDLHNSSSPYTIVQQKTSEAQTVLKTNDASLNNTSPNTIVRQNSALRIPTIENKVQSTTGTSASPSKPQVVEPQTLPDTDFKLDASQNDTLTNTIVNLKSALQTQTVLGIGYKNVHGEKCIYKPPNLTSTPVTTNSTLQTQALSDTVMSGGSLIHIFKKGTSVRQKPAAQTQNLSKTFFRPNMTSGPQHLSNTLIAQNVSPQTQTFSNLIYKTTVPQSNILSNMTLQPDRPNFSTQKHSLPGRTVKPTSASQSHDGSSLNDTRAGSKESENQCNASNPMNVTKKVIFFNSSNATAKLKVETTQSDTMDTSHTFTKAVDRKHGFKVTEAVDRKHGFEEKKKVKLISLLATTTASLLPGQASSIASSILTRACTGSRLPLSSSSTHTTQSSSLLLNKNQAQNKKHLGPDSVGLSLGKSQTLSPVQPLATPSIKSPVNILQTNQQMQDTPLSLLTSKPSTISSLSSHNINTVPACSLLPKTSNTDDKTSLLAFIPSTTDASKVQVIPNNTHSGNIYQLVPVSNGKNKTNFSLIPVSMKCEANTCTGSTVVSQSSGICSTVASSTSAVMSPVCSESLSAQSNPLVSDSVSVKSDLNVTKYEGEENTSYSIETVKSEPLNMGYADESDSNNSALSGKVKKRKADDKELSCFNSNKYMKYGEKYSANKTTESHEEIPYGMVKLEIDDWQTPDDVQGHAKKRNSIDDETFNSVSEKLLKKSSHKSSVNKLKLVNEKLEFPITVKPESDEIRSESSLARARTCLTQTLQKIQKKNKWKSMRHNS